MLTLLVCTFPHAAFAALMGRSPGFTQFLVSTQTVWAVWRLRHYAVCVALTTFAPSTCCRRRFSQQIRQVLARGEGALAEARPLCDSQMDDAHAMLASDPAFRAEWAAFC